MYISWEAFSVKINSAALLASNTVFSHTLNSTTLAAFLNERPKVFFFFLTSSSYFYGLQNAPLDKVLAIDNVVSQCPENHQLLTLAGRWWSTGKQKEPFGFLTFKKLKISNPFRFRFEGRIEEQILLGTVESTVREQWISI